MEKKIIIIGGGLGGLFTGAILSREGCAVTVLEKNRIIGGGLQSFPRFGELFDTGMHIIGGMQKDGNIRRICEYLGIWDKVRVKDTDPRNIDRIFYSEDGRTYNITKGRVGFVDSLSRDFPSQRENLERYVDALYALSDEVDLFYMRPSTDYMQVHSEDFQMAASSFIAKYIDDPHLRSVVAYLNPLYGGKDGVTPAYIHALISVLYIDGSSRFAGGSILFAETLREFIESHGGKVIAGKPVTAVHSEGKLITGVTTSDGKTFSGDEYICAIHPCTFLPLLDDPAILPKPYRERLSELPNSYSAFTLNIKLRKNTFRFFNYTMYYMSRYDAIWKFGETEKWPCGFLYITPPEINQGEYADKVIVTAPMQWRAVEKWVDTVPGHRGEEYEKWKEECTGKLLDCMEEISPGFRDCIEAVNSASPLTIRDFYGVKEGSMYGFSKDCSNLVRSQVPVVTKVPNLFLTGQNCNLHGFCGVSLTAINTAEAILGQNRVLGQIDRFNAVKPFTEAEIYTAMQRISSSEALPALSSRYFPGEDEKKLRVSISRIDSTARFFDEIVFPALDSFAEKSREEVLFEGDCGESPALYLCTCPDSLLGAALGVRALHLRGLETPEVGLDPAKVEAALRDLISAHCLSADAKAHWEEARDILRSAKVFKADPADPAMLRDYIIYALSNRRQSVWIDSSLFPEGLDAQILAHELNARVVKVTLRPQKDSKR